MWVDDPNDGLPREPFVNGPDRMIDRVVADIPNAARGFKLTFSARPFPGPGYSWTGARRRRRQLVSIGAILLCHCQGPAEPRSIQSKHLQDVLDRSVTLLTSTAVSAALAPIPSRTSHEPWRTTQHLHRC